MHILLLQGACSMAETFIKNRREELGYSQSQLAELAGINYRTLQDYEQGRKPLASIRGDYLIKLSSALGCSMEELFIEREPNPNYQKKTVKKYLSLIDASLDTKHSRIINTPFDDVFRTLSVDCSKLLIPVINLAFGENYPIDTPIVRAQNEHLAHGNGGESKKRITDSNIFVVGEDEQKINYQIECQSRRDSTIIIRLFEYASLTAVEGSVVEGNKLKITFPKSALIYLRHNDKTPSEMEVELLVPSGQITWKIPVLKSQMYSIDEIFEKKLYFFIPFYLLIYENSLYDFEFCYGEGMLKKCYEMIFQRLEKLVEAGELDSYSLITIRNMSKRVVDHMTKSFGKIGSEVNAVLGGEVLEYEAKDIKREGKMELVKNIMESMSISLEEALRLVKIPESEFDIYKKML